ncbi:MAG: helix-turn-helix domain-containing protein [Alphaproteobacteria bacterium]
MSDHVPGKGLRRAELARRTGCNLETIRYYETIGLMPGPPRTAAGHRVYDEDHAARLRFIMRARELGFSIEELKSLLSLVDSHRYTCGEVRDLTVAHRQAVRRKIADLRRLERTLTRISEKCSGDAVPKCPIIDALRGD